MNRLSIAFACFLMLLSSMAAKSQENNYGPEWRLKVNPGLLISGEYGLTVEYRQTKYRAYEARLGWMQFPSTIYQNLLPPNQGPSIQLGMKNYFFSNDPKPQRHDWWGAFILFRNLRHDSFYFPGSYQRASSTTNVVGVKLLKGFEWHIRKFMIEPYYGLSFRAKWGTKTVHCRDLLADEPCPADADLMETSNQFAVLPSAHFGFRIGLRRPVAR